MLHEFGHLIGLDHTSDRTQIMFSEAQLNVRDYADGDLRGLSLARAPGLLSRGLIRPEPTPDGHGTRSSAGRNPPNHLPAGRRFPCDPRHVDHETVIALLSHE